MTRPDRGDAPAFRHRPDVSRTHLPASMLLLAATMALGLGPAPVPLPFPDWSVWVPAVLAALVALHAWMRPGISLDEGGLTVHRRGRAERFARRAIARVEMASWSDRTDIHLVLRGGGVRRIPARAIPSPRAFAAALGRRGIVVLAV